MKWLPQRFNDSLAIVVVVGVPLMWFEVTMPEAVLGATIAAWVMVVQYYFRKKGGEV